MKLKMNISNMRYFFDLNIFRYIGRGSSSNGRVFKKTPTAHA